MNRKVSYPQLKQSTSLGPAKQYNAIVNFILRQKYGVKASSITDCEMFLKRVADLFWEFDPNYSKFKSRRKSSPKTPTFSNINLTKKRTCSFKNH